VSDAATSVTVTLQVAVEDSGEVPDEDSFSRWVKAACGGAPAHDAVAGHVTVRIVNEAESTTLNAGYRGKSAPTNVLAFVAATPPIPIAEQEERELGDLVICLAVAAREAREQGKQLSDHLAHLTVHGTLHLLGYDHLDDAEAEGMEGLEQAVMTRLGLPDPYAGERPEG